MKKFFFLLFVSTSFLVYKTQAQIVKISPSVFSDSLQTQQNLVLLDVRTPEEFTEGHLKNALNIDFKNSDFKNRIGSLDKNKTYYVYCRSGNRSAAAVEKMKALGFKNIYELDGGMLKWVEAGMQTVKVVEEQ